MVKQLVAAAVVTLSAIPVRAEITYYAPEDYSVAWVNIVDLAKNGCWTNIGETKTYAEDQMALAGFNVGDTPDAGEDGTSPILTENGILLNITVQGERLSNGLCVGYMHTEFYASLHNPNRSEYMSVGPIGNNGIPFSVWNNKNFNEYVFDYLRGSIGYWVQEGVVDFEEQAND
ncbi:hypothetical protein [Ruegeria sp. HKCCA4707]|uniref:hypothetical protein n=1 Tax=Ruegeria sp. HKCCA4707 TaxID=2682984 RepID=UPI001489A8AB|nr:hypothetical protein [Ruegeria sp. HKCCA4707]